MATHGRVEADTIAAIASPAGGALRGVVRLSGALARTIVERACSFDAGASLDARDVLRAKFDDGVGSQPVLVLWMPGPASYTREDVAEIHGPGAPQLVAAVLRRVLELGARQAGPGEFTRRAFESGRLDLARAEGVLELVQASNERERRAATALLFGGLSERIAAVRDELLELRVLCEATLDFDEADTGHVPHSELIALAERARATLERARSFELRRSRAGVRPRVVSCGPPNAGKSSLFNALCGSRALVSEHPGTTRDTLSAEWRIGARALELIDTAGLDVLFESADERHPDAQAQRRARAELGAADLLLVVLRADTGDAPDHLAWASRLPTATRRVLAWSQCDRSGARPAPPRAWLDALGDPEWTAVSAVRGSGLDELAAACAKALDLEPSGESSAAAAIGERHLAALERSHAALEDALANLHASSPLDLVAQAAREALDALDDIEGRTSPEDVLDRLFARFCIGK